MAKKMNTIEKLIAELCPEGVEFRYIWEVTAWDKKFNAVEDHKQKKVIKYNYLLASELKNLQVERGNIKLLTTNNSELFTTEEIAGERVSEGEVVTIPWGGTANVQYYSGKFLTADNRLATSLNTTYLNNKYLYYVMLDRTDEIQSFYRGSGIQHPNMAKVLDMKIPIPPLAIQQEIVKILDTFTTLEAELEAELEARKKQYEYYRDELLTFGEDVEWKTLGETCDYVDYRGKTPKKTADGIFLVTAKNIRRGYIDYSTSQEFISEDDYNSVMRRGLPEIGDVLVTTEAPCGFVAQVDRENIALAQRVIKYRSKNELLGNSFLKHYLLGNQFQEKLNKTATGSTVKGIKGSKLHKLTIPIPPLAEQQRIVAILDKFDALVNDISVGLPAELNARRKQYEHYRGKLLTFEPLEKEYANP